MSEITSDEKRRLEMLNAASLRNHAAIKKGLDWFRSYQFDIPTLQEMPIWDLVVEIYRRVAKRLRLRR